MDYFFCPFVAADALTPFCKHGGGLPIEPVELDIGIPTSRTAVRVKSLGTTGTRYTSTSVGSIPSSAGFCWLAHTGTARGPQLDIPALQGGSQCRF